MTLHLAEYQIRLLLCRPDRKELLSGGEEVRLHWPCGCSAAELPRKRYRVRPCGQHESLLIHVAEDEERQYDGFGNQAGPQRAWLRFAASASTRKT